MLLFDRLSPDARMHIYLHLNVKEVETLCRACNYRYVFTENKYDDMWRTLIVKYYKFKPIYVQVAQQHQWCVYEAFKKKYQKWYSLVNRNCFGDNPFTTQKEQFKINDFFKKDFFGGGEGHVYQYFIRGFAFDGTTEIRKTVSREIFEIVKEIVDVDVDLDDTDILIEDIVIEDIE